MANARVRGPYKAYLRNNAAVPDSTLRYRRRRAQVPHIQQPAYENPIIDERMDNDEPINDEEMDNVHPEEMDNVHLLINDEIHNDNEANMSFDNDNSNDSDNYDEDNDNDVFEDAEEHFDNVEYGTQEENEPNRIPLYDGCRVSTEEGYLLLLHFAIRHHLTDIALQHLITLIDMLLPQKVFRSNYLFLKQHPALTSVIKCYYCPNCHVILNAGDAQRYDEMLICPECSETYCSGSRM